MNTLTNAIKDRENLATLNEYMESSPECNITEFNTYVKKQLETPVASRETMKDLITNLFKGYSHAKDKDFPLWICSKKQTYFEKTSPLMPMG